VCWRRIGKLAIGGFQCVRLSAVVFVLYQVQHRLPLGSEAGTALDRVGAPGGRQQAAGGVKVGMRGAQTDGEHLFQVVDNDLGVHGGGGGARGPDRAVGRPWSQRSLHGGERRVGASKLCKGHRGVLAWIPVLSYGQQGEKGTGKAVKLSADSAAVVLTSCARNPQMAAVRRDLGTDTS